MFICYMQWVPEGDVFTYELSPLKLILTKRGILITIARIFDLLFLLAQTIFCAKCIKQGLFLANATWDEQLSNDVIDE